MPPSGLLGNDLPEPADAVPVEQGFVGYERNVASQRLGDEHPVEGVAVELRQGPGARGVVHGDGQFLETLAGDGPGKVQGYSRGLRKLAKPMFGGNLPGSRRADQFLIGRVENGVAYRLGYASAVGEPPNQRVGVEQ